MPDDTPPPLRIGVLGAGAIAQAAHFEACTRARNASLYAICDVAEDLLARMAARYEPAATYRVYDEMLADPNVDAVIVATADAFHVPASLAALRAGKHVLCEKPLGTSVEEVESLHAEAAARGRQVMVGHMKRFDPGLQAARDFVGSEMGEMLAYKGWYCDSTHRYEVTDAVQPRIVRSTAALKPPVDPKADRERYYLLAHGSHLVDTARFLCGEIVAVDARLTRRFGAYSWLVAAELANGAAAQLDLTVAVRMDWHEGIQIYGEHGSVLGKIHNPWLFQAADVEIFRERDAAYTRPLGADAHFYRRQLEAFADAVVHDRPIAATGGADLDDGVASVRALVAIARSAETRREVRLADVDGAV